MQENYDLKASRVIKHTLIAAQSALCVCVCVQNIHSSPQRAVQLSDQNMDTEYLYPVYLSVYSVPINFTLLLQQAGLHEAMMTASPTCYLLSQRSG